MGGLSLSTPRVHLWAPLVRVPKTKPEQVGFLSTARWAVTFMCPYFSSGFWDSCWNQLSLNFVLAFWRHQELLLFLFWRSFFWVSFSFWSALLHFVWFWFFFLLIVFEVSWASWLWLESCFGTFSPHSLVIHLIYSAYVPPGSCHKVWLQWWHSAPFLVGPLCCPYFSPSSLQTVLVFSSTSGCHQGILNVTFVPLITLSMLMLIWTGET